MEEDRIIEELVSNFRNYGPRWFWVLGMIARF